MAFKKTATAIGVSCLVVLLSTANTRWARAAAGPTRLRVFADFENAAAVTLRPSEARARRVRRGDGHALEITTEAAAQWPSVTMTPPSGRWDFRGFYSAEMDVFNPQSVPVRVLLSLSNPGSDGQKNNNSTSITVPANGTATLQLPFGTWHGETNRTLDQANVVSAAVMLDRPGRGHRFVVDNLRVVPFGSGISTELMASEYFQALRPVLGRGVNLGNMLEAPREGDWGARVEQEYFELIRSAGFDSIRVPVRWSAHAMPDAPYTIDPEFLARVEWVVRQAMSHRLHTVLNVHHYDELFKHPARHQSRFLALWDQLATHFRDFPAALYFELLNEPHDKLDADTWNKLAPRALAVIRRTNPSRQVIIGAGDWNGVDALPGLVLPQSDPNLIATFHYYKPFQFTHQGAGWIGGDANKWLGTTWTGTPAERQAVINDLDRALLWSVEHRIPIYLGEFGAYRKADLASRVRWTRFVANEAAKRKIGFAYWEFCSEFGVYDPKKKVWVESLKSALLDARR